MSKVNSTDVLICLSCRQSICRKCVLSSNSTDLETNQILCIKCIHEASATGDALLAQFQGKSTNNDVMESCVDIIVAQSPLRQPTQEVSARDLISLITVVNHWDCRSCGIYGTYKSPHNHFCGGAYFGWLIGATPTEGRTCCNCVKRVTGSDAGYALWSCSQCKRRKAGLASLDFNTAGFEVGMSTFPLNSPEGIKWLLTEAGEQSGPEWMRCVPRLDVSGLQFTDLNSLFTAPLYTFSNIVKINISRNGCIERVPIEELCSMENLIELECDNCPRLISPPPEIAQQGGLAVMKFLHALVKNGGRNTSMVLFLIGDGECGKTSLLSALKAGDKKARKIDRDNRTVGIDITYWDLRSLDAIDFVVYDMAGQSVYKDTHTYFVGRRAIYVFVWRLVPSAGIIDITRRLTDMVESWVDTLQFRIPGASIMAVATHADCVTTEEMRFQTKQVGDLIIARSKSYVGGMPIRVWNHGDSIVVNSLGGVGIEEAQDQVVGFAKSLPWYNELLPKSWLTLESRLSGILHDGGRYFLQWDEYSHIVLTSGVPSDMVLSATTFFHETGKLR